MGPSYRTQRDRVLDRVRRTLTAVGAFECVTLSFVSDELCELFRPRGNEAALHVEHSSRRHENVLRQSLIPSLLVSRRENERQGNANAELFEVARVFLSADRSLREQETEPIMVSMVSGRSFRELRGVVETLASAVNPKLRLQVEPSDLPAFSPGRGAELLLAGNRWGWRGELRRDVTDRLDLRDAVTVFEVELSPRESLADRTPAFEPLPTFPGVTRDLNFLLDESVRWRELEQTVRSAAGPLLDDVAFGGEYRGKQIPADKKSYVVQVFYRSPEKTLTHEEVEIHQQAVVETCREKLGAQLR